MGGYFDKHDKYIPPRLFRLCPRVTKVNINMKMHGLKQKCVFKNYYMRQYRTLVNTATTGHKLQGMYKDSVFVTNWFYGVNIVGRRACAKCKDQNPLPLLNSS